MRVSDRTGEAIKGIVCCSSRSRPWYKECFILFVEESKYIWLQDRQPSSSVSGFFFMNKDGRTGAPFSSFHLKPVWQTDMLIPDPVWTGYRNINLKTDPETIMDQPHPCGENSSYPAPLGKKGAFVENAFEDRKCHFSSLLSQRGFSYIWSCCQHIYLDTSCKSLINKFTVISCQLWNNTLRCDRLKGHRLFLNSVHGTDRFFFFLFFYVISCMLCLLCSHDYFPELFLSFLLTVK